MQSTCLCLFVSVNVNKLWIIWIKLSAGVDWIWKGGRSPGTWFEHIGLWGAVCFTRSTTPSIPITDPNFACSPILVHTPFSGAGTIFSLGEWAWRDGNRKNSNNCSCRNLLSPVADTATHAGSACMDTEVEIKVIIFGVKQWLVLHSLLLQGNPAQILWTFCLFWYISRR